MKKRTVLIWFRNDLRIHDNEMLSRASLRGEKIVPVYIFDPRYYYQTSYETQKTGSLRAQFIIESVQSLCEEFQELGGQLIVAEGFPEEVIPQLALKYEVDEVYHHREVAKEETDISSHVEDALWRQRINLRHFIGHTLFHKEDFPFPVRDIPNSFPVFVKKLERESFIRPSFENPKELKFLPGLESGALPTLTQLGFKEDALLKHNERKDFFGGEKEGRSQLARSLVNRENEEETVLSPWISLGCLSVHDVYFSVQESDLPKATKEQILNGLYWKDYLRFMFKKYGNLLFQETGFTGTAPHVVPDQKDRFEKWKSGGTENEQVNLLMRQLKAKGFINHESRNLVASYLIDELQVSWLYGAAYFEEALIDYNPTSNYGNWAHLAGVGSSAPNNRLIKQ